jgi:hypothetical protein
VLDAFEPAGRCRCSARSSAGRIVEINILADPERLARLGIGCRGHGGGGHRAVSR